jgi:hypothetical protein
LPERKFTFSPEGTKIGGTAEMEWEREARGVTKQKNLTPEDTVNWKKMAKINGQPVSSVTPGHCYKQNMDIKVSNKCHILWHMEAKTAAVNLSVLLQFQHEKF